MWSGTIAAPIRRCCRRRSGSTAWREERQKPDAEREPGYPGTRHELLPPGPAGARPAVRSGGRQGRVDAVPRQVSRPAGRGAGGGARPGSWGSRATPDRAALESRIDGFYDRDPSSATARVPRRPCWRRRPRSSRRASDPFIRSWRWRSTITSGKLEAAGARCAPGALLAVRPAYMEAITGWQALAGACYAYPDANSTLRVTYGTVLGGVAARRDGLSAVHDGRGPGRRRTPARSRSTPRPGCSRRSARRTTAAMRWTAWARCR